MCGIAANLSQNAIVETLLSQLQQLSYRGYDSAGIAFGNAEGIHVRKTPGAVEKLYDSLPKDSTKARVGIGHTRWATHGGATQENAHPHCSDKVAVVHNGIIENADALREQLKSEGVVFQSETDSEVIPHLIEAGLNQGLEPALAIRSALEQIHGQYALVILFNDNPDRLYAICQDSPLYLGQHKKGYSLASDVYALAGLCQQTRRMEDQELACVTLDRITLQNANNIDVLLAWEEAPTLRRAADLGVHGSRLEQEIFQQPRAVFDTLAHCKSVFAQPNPMSQRLADAHSVQVIGCGTSFYAGTIAKRWIESQLHIPCEVIVASEFDEVATQSHGASPAILISQSGETADLMRVGKMIAAAGRDIIAITNVAESSIARLADHVLETHAGPEISVASTKAFTTQLTALLSLTLAACHIKTGEDQPEAWQAMERLSNQMNTALLMQSECQLIEAAQASLDQLLLLGKGQGFTLAREGSLKMQELAYIHCQAFPTGELKHGPLALIESGSLIVVVALPGEDLSALLGSIREVTARGAQVHLIGPREAVERCQEFCMSYQEMPACSAMTAPILYALPLQQLAMHLAESINTDIDRPRNLAKSVTVL